MNASFSHCNWAGVTCASCDNQVVTAIDLNNNNLKGTLPASLSVLSDVTKL